MIPIHNFGKSDSIGIKVNKLSTLNDYDSSQAHRHDYFELFIFEKGSGIHEIDFLNFEIEPYSVHLVAPGQVHKMKRGLNSNGFVILFEISLFESNSLITDFLFDHICYSIEEMKPAYSFPIDVGKQIVEMSQSIWKDFSSENEWKNDFVLANLNLICIQCMRAIGKNKSEPSKNQQLYQHFRRLLRNNFKSVKRVKDYALDLAISEKQLNEIVSSKTGESTSKIIYNQIILESKRLLNTGLSAKEVGYELNFEDPSHFSKFFKNQTGISPSDFQKIHA